MQHFIKIPFHEKKNIKFAWQCFVNYFVNDYVLKRTVNEYRLLVKLDRSVYIIALEFLSSISSHFSILILSISRFAIPHVVICNFTITFNLYIIHLYVYILLFFYVVRQNKLIEALFTEDKIISILSYNHQKESNDRLKILILISNNFTIDNYSNWN